MQPVLFPSAHYHFVAATGLDETGGPAFFSRRDKPVLSKRISDNFKLKSLVPNVKSIVASNGKQILTQIPNYARSDKLKDTILDCLGFVELVDFEANSVRYLPVTKSIQNQSSRSWESNDHVNDAGFLFDSSASKPGTLYTLDFQGKLREWETGVLALHRSLDEWRKLVMDREAGGLSVETFKESPNTTLRDFNGPKHGKVDPNNEAHFGGNQWAGNSFKHF